MKQKQISNKKAGIRIAVVSFFIMALVFTPSQNLPGLFNSEFEAYFNTNKTAIMLSATIAMAAALLGSFSSGKIFKMFSIRSVVSVLLAVTALTYIGATLSGRDSLLVIYIMVAIRGFGINIMTIIAISTIINNWYAPAAKGKVLGIVMAGSGAGAIVLNPVTGLIIENLGWHAAYYFFAFMSVAMIPLAIWAFIETPQKCGLEKVGENRQVNITAKKPRRDLTMKETVGGWVFWLTLLSFLIINGTSTAWNWNGKDFLVNVGYCPVTASTLISATSIGLTIGKIVIGWICDKAGSTRPGVIICVSCLISAYFMNIFGGQLPWLTIVAAALIGWGMSINTIVMPLVVSEFFGGANYTSALGFVQAGSCVGSCIFPLIVSGIYDSSQSYTNAWMIFSAVISVAFGFLLFAFLLNSKLLKKEEAAQAAAVEKTSETV